MERWLGGEQLRREDRMSERSNPTLLALVRKELAAARALQNNQEKLKRRIEILRAMEKEAEALSQLATTTGR